MRSSECLKIILLKTWLFAHKRSHTSNLKCWEHLSFGFFKHYFWNSNKRNIRKHINFSKCSTCVFTLYPPFKSWHFPSVCVGLNSYDHEIWHVRPLTNRKTLPLFRILIFGLGPCFLDLLVRSKTKSRIIFKFEF